MYCLFYSFQGGEEVFQVRTYGDIVSVPDPEIGVVSIIYYFLSFLKDFFDEL